MSAKSKSSDASKGTSPAREVQRSILEVRNSLVEAQSHAESREDTSMLGEHQLRLLNRVDALFLAQQQRSVRTFTTAATSAILDALDQGQLITARLAVDMLTLTRDWFEQESAIFDPAPSHTPPSNDTSSLSTSMVQMSPAVPTSPGPASSQYAPELSDEPAPLAVVLSRTPILKGGNRSRQRNLDAAFSDSESDEKGGGGGGGQEEAEQKGRVEERRRAERNRRRAQERYLFRRRRRRSAGDIFALTHGPCSGSLNRSGVAADYAGLEASTLSQQMAHGLDHSSNQLNSLLQSDARQWEFFRTFPRWEQLPRVKDLQQVEKNLEQKYIRSWLSAPAITILYTVPLYLIFMYHYYKSLSRPYGGCGYY